MKFYVDADDFSEKNHGFPIMEALKKALPGLKVTLFTVPAQCSWSFVNMVRMYYPWLDMVPHGKYHPHPRECEHWTREETLAYLDWVEGFEMARGFKAPGWQISDGTYQALLERNYWVADQAYNDARRPPKLRAYLIDQPYKLHFHVQDVCGNGLSESFDRIVETCRGGEFGFVRELM